MEPQQYNTDASRRRRKRARPTNHPTIHMPKATLMTSLLWLVAFTNTHPSSVGAFVLASDRPSFHRTTATAATSRDVSRLFASTLAEVELGSSQLDQLLEVEERPEDVLNLAHLPLLLLPKHGQQQQEQQSALDQINIPDEEEVLEWAERYTSVEALRQHFGTNQNKLWGDLQASTARRLYKTLLPRALLELSKLGKVQPQDLAPLAYQARVAAKLYARERCTVPARIAATLFDGFRQWIKYGKFQGHGMTYDQLWEKYAEKILLETESEHLLHPPALHPPAHHHDEDDDEECDPFYSDCEDLSEQVCRKILERACVSNEAVDALALKGQDLADETDLQPDQRLLLERIRAQLEQDMYQLLLPPGTEPPPVEMPQLHNAKRRQQGKFRLVRSLAKQRRLWKRKKAQRELAKSLEDKKVWNKPRPKPWLSRSPNHLDSDDETAAETDDEVEEDNEWKP